MSEFSKKKFDVKSPVNLAVAGLTLAGALSFVIVHEVDHAASYKASPTETEIAKTKLAPKPFGIKMSKIGKVSLPGNASETFYACDDDFSNSKSLLIDRVVLSPAKGTNVGNYYTYMTNAHQDRLQDSKTTDETLTENNWGDGNNSANTISQEMVLKSNFNNYVTFYAEVQNNTSSYGEATVNYLKPFYHLESPETLTAC